MTRPATCRLNTLQLNKGGLKVIEGTQKACVKVITEGRHVM